MTSPTPKAPATPVNDFVRREHIRRTEIMKKQFAAANLDSARHLSRPLFEQHFLPFFCGELPPTAEFFEAWNSVAGTPFMTVHIVDEDRIIATVPPLAEISQVRPQPRDRREGTVSDVLAHAERVGAIDPRGAQVGIIDKLSRRFNAKSLTPAEEHRQAWVDMLKIFGKALQPNIPLDATPSGPPQDDDPFAFD